MSMSSKSLDSLVNQIKVANESLIRSKASFMSNPKYSETLIILFIEEAKRNNGNPVAYDTFKDELCVRLGDDADKSSEVVDVLMRSWNSWYDFYAVLRKEGMLK